MFAFKSKLQKHINACDGKLKTRKNSKNTEDKKLLNNSKSEKHDMVQEITDTSANLEVELVDIDGEAIEIKQLNY